LWIEDGNLRELLRSRKATAELFVDPSPPGGLLVQAGVDVDRLSRRCRTVGIEVLVDGQVVRARSIPPGSQTPPPARVSPVPRKITVAEGKRRTSSEVRIQTKDDRKEDD
jgi:hypothetical protein